jgi:hypothetical protein
MNECEHQDDHPFLYDFISQNTYTVLSTVKEIGSPAAALVGIAVTTDLTIISDNDVKL